MRIGLLLVVLCFPISMARGDSQVIHGEYRFTVITPNLIRIERSTAKMFVDAPTLFGFVRSSRAEATVSRQGERLMLDTGVISLTCNPSAEADGEALTAVIKQGGKTYPWHAGKPNHGNLGGTLQTLDQVSGPVDLGQGLLSRDGWAIVDDSGKHIFKEGWIAPRPQDDGAIDWYLFGYGQDYKAALQSLAAISGPVPAPRKYALGAWYSRYWPYTSADYRNIVKEYDDNGFPLDVIVLDMDWHITDVPEADGGGWTGFSWDRKLLPDAEALLAWFRQQNLAVTLNLHPAKGVRKHDTAFEPMMRELGLDPTKDPAPKFDIGDRRYVQAFFKHAHNPLEDAGVSFWWMDWQQDGDMPFVPSVPGLKHLPWLNHLYFQQSQRNGLRGLSFSRWGGWGDHRHPIHFSGDATTNWESLAFQVPFTSTAGNVGCFFWSHDIGGHFGERNEESYTRWCQFGAVSAALRSHSGRIENLDRRPWTYPNWATDSMRKSFRLRSELFPYIYSSVLQGCAQTIPLNRPMYLDFPDEEQAYRNPQQFMFGDALLCAPITMPGPSHSHLGWQVVWFPPGRWYNFFTGERYQGGTTQVVAADINEFPLFVRAGVPVPMRPYTNRMATAKLDELVVRLYPGIEGATQSTTLLEDDGITPPTPENPPAQTRIEVTLQPGAPVPLAHIRIAPTIGTYNGQPRERKIVIELAATEPLTSVRAGEWKVTHSYDAKTRVNRIEAADVPIDREIAIGVEVMPANQELIGNESRLRRRQSWDGINIGFLFDATAAIDGVALMPRGDSPTGFGGRQWLELIVPPGAEVGSTGKLRFDADDPQTIPLRAGEPIALPSPFATTAKERTIWSPGRGGLLDCLVNGVNRQLTAEAPPWPHAPDNLAATAAVTASSTEAGYDPRGAIDNQVNGYPLAKQAEWASDGEKAGATLTLKWEKPVTASKVILFDRPNKADQVLGFVLHFSDGSTVTSGEIGNNGSAAVISFDTKTFTELTLEITKVSPSTHNAGLSEIAVFP